VVVPFALNLGLCRILFQAQGLRFSARACVHFPLAPPYEQARMVYAFFFFPSPSYILPGLPCRCVVVFARWALTLKEGLAFAMGLSPPFFLFSDPLLFNEKGPPPFKPAVCFRPCPLPMRHDNKGAPPSLFFFPPGSGEPPSF